MYQALASSFFHIWIICWPRYVESCIILFCQVKEIVLWNVLKRNLSFVSLKDLQDLSDSDYFSSGPWWSGGWMCSFMQVRKGVLVWSGADIYFHGKLNWKGFFHSIFNYLGLWRSFRRHGLADFWGTQISKASNGSYISQNSCFRIWHY